MGKVLDILSGKETFDYHPLPNKKYKVILADPNWKFSTWSDKGLDRSAEKHYETNTVDEIGHLPIEHIADKDCALFMWVTDPVLPMAINLASWWGFTYKTVAFTWVKKNKKSDSYFVGMGYTVRKNPEMCLLFTKGKSLTRQDKGVQQLVVSKIREHSRKPDEVKDRIHRLFGDVPKIELFAREQYDPEHWDYWGNQINKFDNEEEEQELMIEVDLDD